MEAAKWRQVKEIFLDVLNAPEESRARFLDEACAGDAALRGEVESLLAAHFESESFIEKPVFEVAAVFQGENSGSPAAAAASAPFFSPAAEKRFGHYRIVREIGVGGMGAVFLAERDDGEFRRRAAVKVIRQTLADSHLIGRFRRERQILASLNHANIARLLDGGVSDDGLPYLVMEYVEGEPITEYVEKNNPSVEERLRLFLKICAAVAYAHRNLVVHRDLKPSNILVTDQGDPVLLDFGLAKLLDDNLDADSNETATAFRAMTPAYASPEQLRGQPITTASDIYSLGVVLYELLTGRRPFNLKSQSLDEAVRVVCGAEPVAPSRAISDSGFRISDLKPGNAQNGSGDDGPPKINPKSEARNPKSLRGDLDNIVLKALRKEPERRYRSIEQFADDIERYLKGLPVSARPATFWYRAGKFVRRNKISAAAAALVLLSLLGGIVATAWQARVAAQERDRAVSAQNRAQRINSFLQDMLKSASPEEKGQDARVIDVINDAAQRIDTEFNEQPEQKIEMLLTLGQTYQALGMIDPALQKLQRAQEVGLQNFGETHRLTAETQIYLAQLHLIIGNSHDAAEFVRRASETLQKLSLTDTKEYAQMRYVLGELLLRRGEAKEAEAVLSSSYENGKKFFGENSLELAMVDLSLGRARQVSGDLDSAEASFRRTAGYFRQSPRYRLRMSLPLVNLGYVLILKGKYDEADAALLEADEINRSYNVNSDYQRGIILNYRSQIQFVRGDYAGTEALARESVKLWEPIVNKEDGDFLNVRTRVGSALLKQGRAAEAEKVFLEVLDITKKRQNNEPWRLPLINLRLGESLMEQNRLTEAEPLLTSAAEDFVQLGGANNVYGQQALKAAVTLFERANKPDLVAKYRALLSPDSK